MNKKTWLQYSEQSCFFGLNLSILFRNTFILPSLSLIDTVPFSFTVPPISVADTVLIVPSAVLIIGLLLSTPITVWPPSVVIGFSGATGVVGSVVTGVVGSVVPGVVGSTGVVGSVGVVGSIGVVVSEFVA